MHASLNQNLFLVKEKVGFLKASNNYDIYDPATSQIILKCHEPNLGLLTKLFRFTDFKRMTPFHVVVETPEGKTVLSITRGFSLFMSKVEVRDENNKLAGMFQQKWLSIGGKFDVLSPAGNVICTLKGKWTSWTFNFMQGEKELATVSKKWAGIGKELFTSADNYMLKINESVPANDSTRQLIFAAVMCIDMVLKE